MRVTYDHAKSAARIFDAVQCCAEHPASPLQAAVRVVLTLCWIAALPLAAGTFGLFGHMVSMGRHL